MIIGIRIHFFAFVVRKFKTGSGILCLRNTPILLITDSLLVLEVLESNQELSVLDIVLNQL